MSVIVKMIFNQNGIRSTENCIEKAFIDDSSNCVVLKADRLVCITTEYYVKWATREERVVNKHLFRNPSHLPSKPVGVHISDVISIFCICCKYYFNFHIRL